MNWKPELVLDHYEVDGSKVWCWKRGTYSSQEFGSEKLAIEAMEDELLEFSRSDGRDAVDDLYDTVRTERGFEPPFDFWIIGGEFVSEPWVSGEQLGELPDYRLPKGARVLEMTQDEFDELMSDFYMRNGYFPGQ